MNELKIGFGKTLHGFGFQEALDRVTQALAAEGFGVLTEIDVQATLKKKLDVDFKQYRILGACNPSLAHQALVAAPHVGLLLPCNVVVQELAEGEVEVMIADPRAMFSLVREPSLEAVVTEAEQRLRRALDSLE